jgi:hypothetical protein
MRLPSPVSFTCSAYQILICFPYTMCLTCSAYQILMRFPSTMCLTWPSYQILLNLTSKYYLARSRNYENTILPLLRVYWGLPSNGRCFRSQCFATDLYATTYLVFYSYSVSSSCCNRAQRRCRLGSTPVSNTGSPSSNLNGAMCYRNWNFGQSSQPMPVS